MLSYSGYITVLFPLFTTPYFLSLSTKYNPEFLSNTEIELYTGSILVVPSKLIIPTCPRLFVTKNSFVFSENSIELYLSETISFVLFISIIFYNPSCFLTIK